MKYPSIKLISLIPIIVVGILALLGLFFYFFSWSIFGMYKDVVLAKDFFIEQEWNVVVTKDLVKIEKDNHFISIRSSAPFEGELEDRHWKHKGIILPNGDVAYLQMKLKDEYDNEFPFVYCGGRSGLRSTLEIVHYCPLGELPSDRKYTKLLIKSSTPMVAKEIMWSGYDAKDMK